MSLADRRELLAAVLDVLIPADAGFPAAGAIALDHVLSAAAASSETEALLRETERTQPDAFDALVRLTYAGYYSHPEIVTRLGLPPGPVHPRGHRIADAELPDLTRVTSRGPLYRQA